MANNPLIPVPTPETQPFWQGLRERQLRICHCDDCGNYYFPPANVCQHCASRHISWQPVSGHARLYSYVINHRASPEWGLGESMSVALVDLAEGPRLVSTIVNCEQTPEAFPLDMPLRACYREFAGTPMLCFEPFTAAEGAA